MIPSLPPYPVAGGPVGASKVRRKPDVLTQILELVCLF